MSLIFNGVAPKEIKYNGTNLTVLKYSVKEGDLSGEATRASVSSYSKAALDGYVGLVNDTWGGITNASSLSHDKYYYIRVLVTDTNRYGKFCIRFKSSNGQTITTDNIGWGYDGDIITAIPVWGKPFELVCQKNSDILWYLIQRINSPNQHAPIKGLSNDSPIYYGDTITIKAQPINEHYKVKMDIDAVVYTGNAGEQLVKEELVNGPIAIIITGVYIPYMHTLWTGTHSSNVQNSKKYFNWPVTLPNGVTSVSIDVKFSFRGHDVSGTYTVNNSGSVASAFIKHSGVSKTTVTISWDNRYGYYFESTGNSYSATAYIYAIRCIY